jgi:tight adherence protein C
MPASIIIVIFGSIVIIALALTYALSGGAMPVTKRLGRLWQPAGSTPANVGFRQAQRQATGKALAWLGNLFTSPRTPVAEADPRLIMAGFRRPEAVSALRAAKVITILGLEALIYFTGFYQNNPVILPLVAAAAGYILPDMWVSRRIKARQQTLRLSLPDALDLLVICMEAGLGLDQALLYVSQELRIAHPELCEEFDMVNAEMHVGKTRIDALRSLATRTGVEDLQALVATLVQTDRFGTSVAQSLRIHSDDLRVKRRQRAEELAAKTTVKMVFPLVLFIFPALFVVILGPAVITMLHTFSQLK